MAAPRRRRHQNRFLDNLGRITPSTMAMFGIAVLLLLASAGIVGLTMVRRSSATTADNIPTAEPTEFVAIVETPIPTLDTGTATSTSRTSPTVRTSATPQRTGTARVTVTVAAGALGSGSSKGARGVAGSMAIALGGTLPPAQTGAVVPSPTTPAVIPGIPTPTRGASTATRTPANSGGGSTGGGSTGGGSTGGGSTGGGSNPTPTRTATRTATAEPTATRTATALPTATFTPTPRPTPKVAFPGPGSKQYSYNLTFVQSANLAGAPTSDKSYTLTWDTFTAATVKQIAQRIGLSADPVSTGDGYRVNDPKGNLVANNSTGLLRFTAPNVASAPVEALLITPTVEAPGSAQPSPSSLVTPTVSPSAQPSAAPSAGPSAGPSAAPSASPSAPPSAAPIDDAKARDLARDWLVKAVLLPGGTDNGRVTRPTPDRIIVTFHIGTLSATVSDPAIIVVLGTDGAVREVNHHWPKTIGEQPASLRTAQLAWDEWKAGTSGYLEVDQTVPANATTVFTGQATVTKVSVGWCIATDNGVSYLLPVFIFEGTVNLDNPAPGQNKIQIFRIYVQATP